MPLGVEVAVGTGIGRYLGAFSTPIPIPTPTPISGDGKFYGFAKLMKARNQKQALMILVFWFK
jgi:hypothetical protein